DWVNTHEAFQQSNSMSIAFPNTSFNFVGNILGSSEAISAVGSGNLYNSGAMPCTACAQPPANRPYGGMFFAASFGYDTGSDSSGSGVSTWADGPSQTPGYWVGRAFSTAFLHGNYDMASASTNWDIHLTGSHTLPASLYKTAKPSWFGNAAWPAIGPDVSGGIDGGGHAGLIPAQACYNNTPKDSMGLLAFDAAVCYGGATQPL